MQLLSIAIHVFPLIAIIKSIDAYLLLAANLDDIKSIAREFVPEQLVEQLAQAVLDLKHDDTVKGKVQEEFEDVRYDDFSIESLGEPRLRTRNSEAAKRYIISKGKKINFEQLVKNVKKRLEQEFRKKFKIEYVLANVTKKTEKTVTGTHSSFRMKKTRQTKINTTAKEESIETEKNVYKIKTATREKNKHLYYKKDNVFEDLNHKNKLGVSVGTPKKRNDLFEETYLKNSYEDNTTPKKSLKFNKNKIFEKKYSEKEDFKNNNNINKNKRLTEEKSNKDDLKEGNKMNKNKRFKMKKSPKYYNEEEYQTNQSNKFKIKKIEKDNVGKKVKVNKNNRIKIKKSPEDDVEEEYKISKNRGFKIKHSAQYDVKEGKKETRATKYISQYKHSPRKHKAIEVTTENVYDDEFTIQTIASSEIMAETKNLGYDLKSTGFISRKPTIKLTRHRYKVPTPEFVTATTAIAEKYNFDEPIPEHDRVRESIKFFGDPTSNVNKKMKFYDLEK